MKRLTLLFLQLCLLGAFADNPIALDPANGAITRAGGFRSGEAGLWQLKFRDGTTLNAADCRCESERTGKWLTLRYRAPSATVVVTVTGNDFVGQVTPSEKAVLEFALPAKLRFDPSEVQRFISPLHPHLGVGAAFKRAFFERQPSGKFLRYEHKYPPVFSDFFHLDSTAGRVSVRRAQPRSGAEIFVPGRLAFGGDDRGGWCERVFGTFVKPGETWMAPTVRISLGHSAEENLRDYCQANGITRTLREKLSPELFEKLRRAVLVMYDGPAREKTAALDLLPSPSLIHWSDYLKGGFDKEYPDHLPPNPSFGTPEEFRAFLKRAHELGHLTMPYTNPTW